MLTAVFAARLGENESGWDDFFDMTLFVFNQNEDLVLKHVIKAGQRDIDIDRIALHVSKDDRYVLLSTSIYGDGLTTLRSYIFDIVAGTFTVEDDLYFQGVPFTEGGKFISGVVARYGGFNTDFVRYDPITKERVTIRAEAYLNSANLMYRIDYVYGEGNRPVFFDADTLAEVEWIAGTGERTRFYDTGVPGTTVVEDSYTLFIHSDNAAPVQIQTDNPYFYRSLYRSQYGASDYFFAPDRNGGFYFSGSVWGDDGEASVLNHAAFDGVVTAVPIQLAPVYYERAGRTRGQGIWYESGDFMFYGGGGISEGGGADYLYIVQKSPIMVGVTSLDFNLHGIPPAYTYDRSFWDEHFGVGAADLNEVVIMRMVTAMPAIKNIKPYKPFWQKFVLAAEEQI